MLVFLCDNHYDQHGGRLIADTLSKDPRTPLHFVEDDFTSALGAEVWDKASLLVLHMIGGTCGNPLPAEPLCAEVLTYLKEGKPLLLLHGSSAAFWHKDWWRRNTGLRWVRKEDPEGAVASWHPVRPYRLERSKTRHPLATQLQPLDMPEDEIYVGLEQTLPVWTLLETTITEGTFPQAYLCRNEWGGAVAGYLPGHTPTAVSLPANLFNIHTMISTLLQPRML